MKKLIAILLMFAICCSLSVTAFADDVVLNEENQSGEGTLLFYVPSTYCVVIPETLFCDEGMEYRFYASEMRLLDNEQVNVYIDAYDFPLTNSDDELVYVSVKGMQGTNRCVASFRKNNLESDFSISFELARYSPKQYSAGEYTGTIEYTISLEPLGTY